MQKESVLKVMTELRDAMLLQKEVLTIDEVCTYTGFEKSYVYKLCSKKILHHSKPSGKLFFSRAKLVEWLLSNPISTQDDVNKKIEQITKSLKTK